MTEPLAFILSMPVIVSPDLTTLVESATVMFAEPSKDTPLIVLAVASLVAVAAFPVQEPEEPEQFPVTLPVNGPANPVAVRMPVPAFHVIILFVVFVELETLALVMEYHTMFSPLSGHVAQATLYDFVGAFHIEPNVVLSALTRALPDLIEVT